MGDGKMKYKFSLWATIINVIYFFIGMATNLAIIINCVKVIPTLTSAENEYSKTLMLILVTVCSISIMIEFTGFIISAIAFSAISKDSTTTFKNNIASFKILRILDLAIVCFATVSFILSDFGLLATGSFAGSISLLLLSFMFYCIDMAKLKKENAEEVENTQSNND